MNKLLREVPTVESWLPDAEHSFVQVNLDKEFIDVQMRRLQTYLNQWLGEPLEYSNALSK